MDRVFQEVLHSATMLPRNSFAAKAGTPPPLIQDSPPTAQVQVVVQGIGVIGEIPEVQVWSSPFHVQGSAPDTLQVYLPVTMEPAFHDLTVLKGCLSTEERTIELVNNTATSISINLFGNTHDAKNAMKSNPPGRCTKLLAIAKQSAPSNGGTIEIQPRETKTFHPWRDQPGCPDIIAVWLE